MTDASRAERRKEPPPWAGKLPCNPPDMTPVGSRCDDGVLVAPILLRLEKNPVPPGEFQAADLRRLVESAQEDDGSSDQDHDEDKYLLTPRSNGEDGVVEGIGLPRWRSTLLGMLKSK